MLLVMLLLSLVAGSLSQELIQNGGMESKMGWSCPGGTCSLTNTRHGGSNAIKVSGSVNTAGNINATDVEIKIIQLKKSFPFGTSIGRYQDFIHAHFNWAVPENDLKWKPVEKRRGRINYRRPLNVLKKLKSNGIKIRGHSILWAVDKRAPKWKLLEHWDVNNENLHGFFFQHGVQDATYNLEIFNISHQTAPNVKMFLNDYAVVSRVDSYGAYLTQARQFKAADVGLYGLGAQCHFHGGWIPDLKIIKNTNETGRADMYEKLVRVFYAHPAVEGIMFWGFWSEKHFQKDTASLVSGKEFRESEAEHLNRVLFDEFNINNLKTSIVDVLVKVKSLVCYVSSRALDRGALARGAIDRGVIDGTIN
ncbi:endo-1,4-beta-xylanase 3-like [Gigantopelta aegis]|uniref:endo-1,4-beta-xylanase 3-like n=1 Tax=Gigantopelta aegis TaxID=1735272 RepID=UPI001B888A08|nr:endo-1,4-beta-xylanase 3-like [Gigantopelta aegis]